MNHVNKKTLKIGTFNLLNLVNPEVNFYGKNRYSHADFEKKINWQAQQLDRMQADIVGVQEVFQNEALQQMVERSRHLKGSNLVTANPTGEQPVVGLISKFPVEGVEIFETFPETLDFDGTIIPITHFSRPILKVTLRLSPSVKVIVLTAHLKSKRPMINEGADPSNPIERAKGITRSLLKRTIEAFALRHILVNLIQSNDLPVIVLGDLNDGSLAVSTRLISGEPPLRFWDFEKKKEVWDVLLYHAKDIQARQSYHDYYYTHIHNGHYDSLDHIMVSQEFFDLNPNHIGKIRNVTVFNDHLIDETLTEERIPLWQSDHGQVVATIEMNEPLSF